MVSDQLYLKMSVTNYFNTEKLYQIAQERFRIGKITQNDLLQLEVNMLNSELRITQNEISVNKAKAELASYLGYPQGEVEFELLIPMEIPEIFLDANFVYNLSLNNTSYKTEQKIKLLTAERELAQAKANRGTSVDLRAQFGLNKTAESFSGAYKSPEDYEIVRLGIQVPIMDWGLGRGRVKTKKYNLDLVESQIEQDLIDYERETKIKVYEFNNQRSQCLISEKANNIAQQRYELTLELFNKGSLSVTEFNTAQAEKDNATNSFINEGYKLWSYYNTLQKSTLYDFMANRNITADFDLLIEK
ncbi:MAG: TolC family protein [Odoribacter sp.]|nr:TolC family protein [Odoribacter sp.]